MERKELLVQCGTAIERSAGQMSHRHIVKLELIIETRLRSDKAVDEAAYPFMLLPDANHIDVIR